MLSPMNTTSPVLFRIVTLFCILYSSLLHAQIISKYEHRTIYTSTFGSEIIGNSIFYNRTSRESFDQFRSKDNWIIKSDLNLSPIDSINLTAIIPSLGVNDDLRTVFMKNENDTLEIILQKLNNVGCLNPTSYILKFDSTLNLTDSSSWHGNMDGILLAGLTRWNGKQLAYGTRHSCNLGVAPSVIIDLSHSDSVIFDLPIFNTQYDIINDVQPLSENELLVLISKFASQGAEWAILDSNFQLVKRGNAYNTSTVPNLQFAEILNLIQSSTGSLPKFVGTGSWSNTLNVNERWNLLIGTVDTSSIYSPMDTFWLGGRFHDTSNVFYSNVSSGFDAIDDINPDSVRIIQTPVLMTNYEFSNQLNNPVFVYNYNSRTGTMNWEKEIRTGYSQGSQFALSALPGNRTLIGINEYNPDKFGPQSLAIHWLILDENGTLISEEYQPATYDGIYLSPNPMNGFGHLHGLSTEEKYTYAIYSTDGREIYTSRLQNHHNILLAETLELTEGVFLLKITSTSSGFQKVIRFVCLP